MTPEEYTKICEEYDKAPDDCGWDEGHPIFLLAQDNDNLRKEVLQLKRQLLAISAIKRADQPA